MNKSELVARLTERLGGDRTIATAAVNGVLEEIESSVARGERVSLIGFGTFDRRERAARTGRNPQTGAAIQLAASVAPVFRPGAGFRSLLTPNGGPAAVRRRSRRRSPRRTPRRRRSPAKKAAAAAAAAAKNAGQGRTRQGQQEGAEEGDRQGREEGGEEGPLNRRAQACPEPTRGVVVLLEHVGGRADDQRVGDARPRPAACPCSPAGTARAAWPPGGPASCRCS